MIKITIGNSVSRVDGLDRKHFDAIRKLMSYNLSKDKQFWGGAKSYGSNHLMSKRGDFPTGLLYILQNYLKANNLLKKVIIKQDRFMPVASPGLFKLLDTAFEYLPYPEQNAAAEAARAFKRGIIVAPTGVGKSAIATLIISKIAVPTLIVVPSLELKRQMTESLIKAFGAEKVGSFKENSLIAVENIDSLDPKVAASQYDCVIIDEFHHSGAKSYRKLNKKAWSGIFYKFGLTATPFRSQDEERLLLESVLSKVIYQIDYKDAVAKGYIVPMRAFYVEIPKTNIEGYSWAEVYNEAVVNNTERNEIIVSIIKQLKYQRAKTLCLVKEIDHGKLLSGLSNTPFINGGDLDSRLYLMDFNTQNIECLIGTTGVIGEGVDTKPCEYVIIAGLGKSKNAFMQQVGRGFRKFKDKQICSIIIFYDKSHKFTKSHFSAQRKILKEEYGVELIKLVV